MRSFPGTTARVSLAGFAAAGLVLAGPAAAHADAGERITQYDVDVAVHSDGTAHVRESITYDFGANAKHGIERMIDYSTPAGKDRDRVIDVTGIKVSSPDAPAQTEVTDSGEDKEIRVGDPNRTITGVHSYVIEYDTDHVATKAGGGVRYAWNAVGSEWDAPISDVTVHLSGPATMSDAACFAGAAGSTTPCDGADATGTQARFTQSQLDSYEGVTVQADLPAGSVAVAPKYRHVDSGDDLSKPDASPIPDIGTGIAAGVLLLLALAARGYLWHRRRARGRGPAQPGLPDRMTPGLAAYLHDGSENAMVMGTLLDLARRGFLRVDDMPGRKKDWILTRTAPWDPTLPPHEQALLSGLFTGRDQISVGELRNRFRGTVGEVTRTLADDAALRGWVREPYARWALSACAVPFFGYAVVEFFARNLPGWPFLAFISGYVGVTILTMAGELFRLNAAGEHARRQVQALRERLADPAGAQEIDAEWALPYAVVFGQARQWETRFGDGTNSRMAFYTGAGLAAFATTGASSITSSPSGGGGSGGGGFSGGSVGGGGGGGGGGSW